MDRSILNILSLSPLLCSFKREPRSQSNSKSQLGSSTTGSWLVWGPVVWIPIGSCNLKALVSAAKLQGFMFWMFFQEFVPYMGPFLDTLHICMYM